MWRRAELRDVAGLAFPCSEHFGAFLERDLRVVLRDAIDVGFAPTDQFAVQGPCDDPEPRRACDQNDVSHWQTLSPASQPALIGRGATEIILVGAFGVLNTFNGCVPRVTVACPSAVQP